MAREALRKLRLVNHQVCLFSDKERERIFKKYPFLMVNNDSDILADAVLLSTKLPIIIFTNDILMLYLAQNCIKEINGEFFEPADSNKELWQGWQKFYPTIEEMVSLYSRKNVNILNAKQNEFCEIYEGQEIKDISFWNGLEYVELKYSPIHEPGLGREKDKDKVNPRNIQQKMAFHLLQNKDIKVKLLLGNYGSGKTFLMLAHALSYINRGIFKKMVFVRNNIEVKNTEKLGSTALLYSNI